MRLTCTKGVGGKGIGVSMGNARRRGTAEIELMLVIPVLLVILFLAGGAMTWGRAWLANVYNAENNVYGQVVAGRGLEIAGDVAPFDGINALKPALPNRFAFADERQVVAIEGVKGLQPVQLEDKAIMLDPAWQISAWPQTEDRGIIQQWFAAYVEESHPADVVQALGLTAPGPP
jgi:hypothetical protein